MTFRSERPSSGIEDATTEMNQLFPEFDTSAEERDLEKHGFKFCPEKQIGFGEGSSIRLATYKNSDEAMAAKIIDRNETTLKRLRVEIEILSKLKHPNIIKVYQILCYPKYIIFFTKKYLKDFLECLVMKGRFSEDEVRPLLLQILDAMYYLHSVHIAHMDMKLPNLMFDDNGVVIVIDFGISLFGVTQEGKRILKKETSGTLGYNPPEVANKHYNPFLVDVFGLGVIVFALVTGDTPYVEYSGLGLLTYQELLNRDYKYPTSFYISPEFKDLIAHMLDPVPFYRWPLTKLLSHEWFHKRNLERRIDTLICP